MGELSLYERLGGVFAVAAVIDHFSDALIKNPIIGATQAALLERRPTPASPSAPR